MLIDRRAFLSGTALVAATSARAQSPLSGSERPLRVGGTGSSTPLLKELADVFAVSGGPRLEIEPRLGSRGGVRAVAAGVLDLAIIGRPLIAGEVAERLRDVPVLRTPLALVTSHPAPPSVRRADVPRLSASWIRAGRTAGACGSLCARRMTATTPC